VIRYRPGGLHAGMGHGPPGQKTAKPSRSEQYTD